MTKTVDYIIRTGRPEDVVGVDMLLSRAYPQLLKADYPPSVMVTAVPLIARAKPGLVTCGTYYVAETEAGEIVGAGGWTLRDPSTGRADGRIGSIRHFATDPGVVRQGVGRRLMRRCLADAIDVGMEGMRCLSTRTAVPFYEALGFLTTREVVIELSPGVRFPALDMARNLGSG